MTNMRIASDIADTIGVINMSPARELPLRYVLFATKSYTWNGGANDYKGKFATIQEAINHYNEDGYMGGQIADMEDDFKIVWLTGWA
jgi:hypothetical protein